MATPNVGILTNAGKNLIDQVNAGQTKITFSKIVFSSMNNNQLTDEQIKALTTVAPQEIVVNNPEVTLDNNTGETRIRATGNNEALTDGVYVKTYAVFAKDDSGNEILYGITVSPNPNYLPEYDGVTPQAVTYSYKVNISNTSNITFTNSNDVYVSDTDLAEAIQPYAKTVDVNQQLDKKVNIADMRKPANDVAGIEEVNAKQDKIGYTPADDGKVVHTSDTSNWQKQAMFNAGSYMIISTLGAKLDFYDLLTQKFTGPGVYYIRDDYNVASGVWVIDSVVISEGNGWWYTYGINTSGNFYHRKITNTTNPVTDTGWVLNADDSKVAHLSGANNFDTVPTVNNNPLLLASSLPADLARTGQAQTFTAAQTFSIAPTITDASKDKGDNQAATMADLKSLENSAWHQLDSSKVTGGAITNSLVLYKIDEPNKKIYLSFVILQNGNTPASSDSVYLDFSGVVNKITAASGNVSYDTGGLSSITSLSTAVILYPEGQSYVFSGLTGVYTNPSVSNHHSTIPIISYDTLLI